ncbi:hypothetical protein JXQ31_13075 [candidate division KSB1 bacterium]|nr:hypothetical protein [candidate division KSB1 bacterium]
MIFSKDQIRYAKNILNKKIKTKQDFFDQEFKSEEIPNSDSVNVEGSKEEISTKIKEFNDVIQQMYDNKYIRKTLYEQKVIFHPKYLDNNGTSVQHVVLETFLSKDKYKIEILDPKALKKAIKRRFIPEIEYLDLKHKKASFWLTRVAIIVSILSLFLQLYFHKKAFNSTQKVQIITPIEIKDSLKVIPINPSTINSIDSTNYIGKNMPQK